MADEPDLTSVIAAAERAASAGDYIAAEQHLREAAVLQEAQFGPVHPDLANTLNNLGVACERAGKIEEAEGSYRRAYAIALAAFPPDHPLVVRSVENLRDFCAARDRPFDPPAPLVPEPPVAEAAPVAPPAPAPVAPPPVAVRVASKSFAHAARAQPAPSSSRRFFPLLAIAAVAVLAIWLAVGRRAPESARVDPASAPTPEVASPTEPVTAPEAAAQPEAAEAPPTGPVEPVAAPAPARMAAVSPPAPAAGETSLTIARADVCRNFSTTGAEWSCDVVADTTAPAVVVFFTRVRSSRPATIVHRWYRNDALVQRVELRMSANAGAGYRTYSRNTVGPGNWRVELLDSAGTVLHQHRFVVR